MIVLGNREFVTGMRLCGVLKSFVIEDASQVIEALKDISSTDMILANTFVVELYPKINKFDNLVTIPDSLTSFDSVDDLKEIINTAVGQDLDI